MTLFGNIHACYQPSSSSSHLYFNQEIQPQTAGLNQFAFLKSSQLRLLRNYSVGANDVAIGWLNSNLPSQPNATLATQARQPRSSGDMLNYLLSH